VMKRNFLVVRFGDTDFGHDLREGVFDLKQRVGDFQNLCPTAIKQFMIAYLEFCQKAKIILKGGGYSDCVGYFDTMRVTFEEKFPSYDPYDTERVDDQGGSVYVDLNTGVIDWF